MTSRQLRRAAERQAAKQARKHQNAPAPEPPSRAETNRANAQHSTGPRTSEGKSASSRNSFKHGLYSQELVQPGENPAELDAIKADLRRENQPVNTTEEILVNEMAEQFWRIRRWRNREAQFMSYEDPKVGLVAFTEMMPILQRLMSAAERGFHKALSALRQLQKDRGFVPHFCENTSETEESHVTAPAEIGFVSQKAQNTAMELEPKSPSLDKNAARREFERAPKAQFAPHMQTEMA